LQEETNNQLKIIKSDYYYDFGSGFLKESAAEKIWVVKQAALRSQALNMHNL